RIPPGSNTPCGHGMLYALPKFKVIAALVPGPWVMGISAGWFRARGIRWLAIGNHVRITGLWANGNHVRITGHL
ncbi:unnamed protein product, partial [Brassica rapa]